MVTQTMPRVKVHHARTHTPAVPAAPARPGTPGIPVCVTVTTVTTVTISFGLTVHPITTRSANNTFSHILVSTVGRGGQGGMGGG